MAATFTPGPWEPHRYATAYYNGPDDAEPFCITAPDDGVILAIAVPDVVPQFEANARLIAAAPELYEALDATHRLITNFAVSGFTDPATGERLYANQAKLFALLAKARGEQVSA